MESSLSPELATTLKQSLRLLMDYKEPDKCCKNCIHYVGNDCSGNANAKSEHCTLNPAINIMVQADGYCKFFKCS